jgi:hypothetical protein
MQDLSPVQRRAAPEESSAVVGNVGGQHQPEGSYQYIHAWYSRRLTCISNYLIGATQPNLTITWYILIIGYKGFNLKF